jgi:hypothetical protein
MFQIDDYRTSHLSHGATNVHYHEPTIFTLKTRLTLEGDCTLRQEGSLAFANLERPSLTVSPPMPGNCTHQKCISVPRLLLSKHLCSVRVVNKPAP